MPTFSTKFSTDFSKMKMPSLPKMSFPKTPRREEPPTKSAENGAISLDVFDAGEMKKRLPSFVIEDDDSDRGAGVSVSVPSHRESDDDDGGGGGGGGASVIAVSRVLDEEATPLVGLKIKNLPRRGDIFFPWDDGILGAKHSSAGSLGASSSSPKFASDGGRDQPQRRKSAPVLAPAPPSSGIVTKGFDSVVTARKTARSAADEEASRARRDREDRYKAEVSEMRVNIESQRIMWATLVRESEAETKELQQAIAAITSDRDTLRKRLVRERYHLEDGDPDLVALTRDLVTAKIDEAELQGEIDMLRLHSNLLKKHYGRES